MTTARNEWVEAFREFLDTEPKAVPRHLNAEVNHLIDRLLRPGFSTVFLQLLGLHAAVSLLTIALCPHFGIQVIAGFDGMAGLFMKGGPRVCMLACGAFFMAAGGLSATFFLPAESLTVLRRYRLGFALLLTLLSCGLLVAVGNVLAASVPLWLFGGLAGMLISFEIGPRLRYAI